jgi:cell division control protein 12
VRRGPSTVNGAYKNAGESGLGKTTFVNTLFTTSVLEPKRQEQRLKPTKTVNIEITRAGMALRRQSLTPRRAVIEEKGFNVRLTIVDTPGFGDFVNNSNGWQPLAKFIDDQHETQLKQESRPVRDRQSDSRVHACLYFIPPTGHGCVSWSMRGDIRLRPLDIEAMRELGQRANLIPVIAKADTISPKILAVFKERVCSFQIVWQLIDCRGRFAMRFASTKSASTVVRSRATTRNRHAAIST